MQTVLGTASEEPTPLEIPDDLFGQRCGTILPGHQMQLGVSGTSYA